jgi:hypothetical protein
MEGLWVGDEGILILKKCQIHNNKAYNLKNLLNWFGRVESS